MSIAMQIAGLVAAAAVSFARGQAPADKPDGAPPPARWTILFRSDDPSAWDRDAKGTRGEQIAIPVKYAPANTRYVRLRRMDTREALILTLTPDQLQNGKPGAAETAFWWNGTAKEEWKGRHLGIAQTPRHKFPAPRNMIAVMHEGWDVFTGSGFGHKCFVNDGQYYCWRGQEIRRTAFEIAASDGPLSPEETRRLVSRP